MLELALGCGYVDERYWGVIEAVSPIVLKISEVVEHVDRRGAFARIGVECRFFRGAAAPYARRLSVSIHHAMLVQTKRITHESHGGALYADFLKVATKNRLMYGEPMRAP